MPRARVHVTANFERNLEDIRMFLEAGEMPQAFVQLLDDLFERVIPNLEQHPALGRNFLAKLPQSEESGILHDRVQGLLGERGELREYIRADYLVLYGVHGKDIHLLSIRHHRQLSFDFRKFWL
ncbi:MAG: type II toxin-antitoxin system RelE/ParE family toxin [Stenotrophobium sp.]